MNGSLYYSHFSANFLNPGINNPPKELPKTIINIYITHSKLNELLKIK